MSATAQVPPETGSRVAPATGRLARLARLLVARRRLTLLLVGLVAVVAAVAGGGVEGMLSSGGYTPQSAESVAADRLLAQRFHAGAPDLILVAGAPGGVSQTAARQAGLALTEQAGRTRGVVYARSYWSTGDPTLRSRDGRTALVLVKLAGNEDAAYHRAHDLAPVLGGRHGPLDVGITGLSQVNSEAEDQSSKDLTRAEVLAAPLTLLILLAAFGSLPAALLPVLVGLAAVLATYAMLAGLAQVTSVSVFALNITTALGFGLAVDYSLFLISRYREELAAGRDVTEAIAAALRTAGRTVLFSALTVALSMAALLVFPLYFLRSLAYAGVLVVLLAAMAALVVLPPMLAVIGHRIDRWDVFAPIRRRLPGARGPEQGVWHRTAMVVMRRPVAVGGVVAVVLVALALPFLQARFALMDDRVLPRHSDAQVAANVVRDQFREAQTSPDVVVLPDLDAAAQRGSLAAYARRLSLVPHTVRVDCAAGGFTAGRRVAGAAAGYLAPRGKGTWLSVLSDVDPSSAAGERHARDVRAVSAPAPGPVLVGGAAATQVDTKDVLADRLPWAGGVIAASMLVLLFLFSGSVVIPVKQLALNMLSLTASFGAMVYVFQDGRLKWLVGDFVSTGRLEVTVPILMFCVAFGLSMDYSVFLLSRIREEYLATGDTTRAVAVGLERTGRLITAAALVVATVLGALATSQLSILKLLGAGLALAVVVDATLVRGLLVPALMRLLGRHNWWAPGPLRRLHRKVGLTDS
ncbi:MMPL family transporter [Actinacidiphila paucisporea]|uniref:Putative drug exporter of the RND superfamily n=1 Tax=Actinacidiphila paucisporea TaxID=310782 RepID=A0A1M7MZP1_9ACTN|nr:MMPL family transporter [Actinacidiphila paucisporea]SHM96562.1 putative drug exporter of the RND superfamily [Actinacidiphila paucisporea]